MNPKKLLKLLAKLKLPIAVHQYNQIVLRNNGIMKQAVPAKTQIVLPGSGKNSVFKKKS